MSDLSNFFNHLRSKGVVFDIKNEILEDMWGSDSKEGNIRFGTSDNLLKDTEFRFMDDYELIIRDKLESVCTTLDELGLNIVNGKTVGNSSILIRGKDEKLSEGIPVIKLLRGHDVSKFRLDNYSNLIYYPKGYCDENIVSHISITDKLINDVDGLIDMLVEKGVDYGSEAWFETPAREVGLKGCLYARTSSKTKAVYVDESNLAINDSMKLVVGDLAKAFVGVFNTEIFDILYRLYFATNKFKKDTVKDNVPMRRMYIPASLVANKDKLEGYVDDLQELAKSDTSLFETKLVELNKFVLSMYGLTDSEYNYLKERDM